LKEKGVRYLRCLLQLCLSLCQTPCQTKARMNTSCVGIFFPQPTDRMRFLGRLSQSHLPESLEASWATLRWRSSQGNGVHGAMIGATQQRHNCCSWSATSAAGPNFTRAATSRRPGLRRSLFAAPPADERSSTSYGQVAFQKLPKAQNAITISHSVAPPSCRPRQRSAFARGSLPQEELVCVKMTPQGECGGRVVTVSELADPVRHSPPPPPPPRPH
jgi:hypothetical protein